MNQESVKSGFFAFFVKLLIVVLVFGAFPVFLVVVVKNYNRKAEGILEKRNALESVQVATQEELKVLTDTDIQAFQKITNTAIGEWKNPLDPEYRIRLEGDNTFTEYRGVEKVGYGLWRASVKRKEPTENTNQQSTTSSSTSSYETENISGDPNVSYYIIRTQFESGKKTDPVYYEIILLSDSKFSVSLADGSMINFER